MIATSLWALGFQTYAIPLEALWAPSAQKWSL